MGNRSKVISGGRDEPKTTFRMQSEVNDENQVQSPSANNRPSEAKKLPQISNKRGRRVVEKTFPCKICLRPFTNKTSAHLHAHTHLNCDELEKSSIFHARYPHCQKVFFHREHFTHHVNTHEGRKNYDCPVCKMKFTTKAHLTRHHFVHLSGEEQAEVKQGWRHVCYFCQKRFQCPSHLNQHLPTHTSEKLGGSCPVCRKAFSFKQDLTRHHFQHLSQDEKITLVEQGSSRVCLFCGEIFPDNGTYRDHLVTHIAEEPFRCDQCDQIFTKKKYLAGHTKTVHQKVKDIACPECPKMFGTKSNMVKHLNSLHLKIRHPCPHCGQTFTSKSHVLRHFKTVHPSESRPAQRPNN